MELHDVNITQQGKPPGEASRALVLLHGRGGSARDILSLTGFLSLDEDFSILAPQAKNNTWYPNSFLAPKDLNQPWLDSALNTLNEIHQDLNNEGIKSENIFWIGFSQGACLTLEYTARNGQLFGGIIAFTGGLIGEHIDESLYNGDFQRTPVFIGTSDPDPHIPVERVFQTEKVLSRLNADPEVKVYPNMGHTINEDEIKFANNILSRRQ